MPAGVSPPPFRPPRRLGSSRCTAHRTARAGQADGPLGPRRIARGRDQRGWFRGGPPPADAPPPVRIGHRSTRVTKGL